MGEHKDTTTDNKKIIKRFFSAIVVLGFVWCIYVFIGGFTGGLEHKDYEPVSAACQQELAAAYGITLPEGAVIDRVNGYAGAWGPDSDYYYVARLNCSLTELMELNAHKESEFYDGKVLATPSRLRVFSVYPYTKYFATNGAMVTVLYNDDYVYLSVLSYPPIWKTCRRCNKGIFLLNMGEFLKMVEVIIFVILSTVTAIATLLLFLINYLYDNHFETTTARVISVDEDKYYSSQHHKKMTAMVATYEYSDSNNNVHQGKMIGSSRADVGKVDEPITIKYFGLIPSFSMYQKIPYVQWITMVMALFFGLMAVILFYIRE